MGEITLSFGLKSEKPIKNSVMLVSVVIPAYNASAFIGDALDSLIRQSDRDWEAVVVDDGSTDNTFEVVSSYIGRDSRIKVVRQNNSGPSMARGMGVSYSNGDWVTFLDADDRLFENAIEVFRNSVKNGHSDIYIYSHVQGWKYFPVTINANEYVEAALTQEFCTGPCCKLFCRSLFAPNVFNLPKWLKSGEDWIMNVRISFNLQGSVTFCKEVIYDCRWYLNSDSLMKTQKTDWNYTDRYFVEFVNSIPSDRRNDYAPLIVQILSQAYHAHWRKCWKLPMMAEHSEIKNMLCEYTKLAHVKIPIFERIERKLRALILRFACDMVERCYGVIARRLLPVRKHKYYVSD